MKRDHISILAQALVYLLTGTFLYTFVFPKTGEPYLAAQIIGGIFVLISFTMLASLFFNHLLTIVERLDKIFLSGLLIASLPVLVTDIVNNIGKPLSYILVIWLLLLIPALIYRIAREQISLGRIVGIRRASMMTLSALAFIFSLIAAISILLNITFVFNPNLWLAFSVIVISIAFILEFWKV